MTNVLTVKNLGKSFKSKQIIQNITFDVRKGEIMAILGPNGAGKSTTIRHLMGFSKPDAGETKIFDTETFNKYYEILNRVGYIPGEIALPAGLTGWEFIRMIQDLQHCHNEERLNYLLKLFDLSPEGETKKMSLGVKRKLAIVTAFMADPDVLILDEPTSGLDPVMQEVFIQFIKDEKERGKTILLSSHIFSEVDATCDRIAIIKDGRIVSEFVANDLKHASTKYYNIKFDSNTSLEKFCKECEDCDYITLIDKNVDESSCFISTDDKDINKVIAILSKYEIRQFTNKKETLEDYFMKFYKEDKTFEGVS